MASLKKTLRSLLPSPLLSAYHFSLAMLGAALYGFPSRRLIVIGVTGTNGKSSTTEYIDAIFQEAGYRTALSNSVRIKIADQVEPSTGRSMPGRFFIQRFLSHALKSGCTVAIIEMTSEGARQYRHRGIALDALVFTNLAPEHIESHGSLQAYADAKFLLGKGLAHSSKRPRIMVANGDDPESARYLALPVEVAQSFTLKDHQPWSANERGGDFPFGSQRVHVHIGGAFYLMNALAAAQVAHAFGIDDETIRKGVARLTSIPGRMERIDEGQGFPVIIDYALTPDALEALYKTFASSKKICVFGSAGGGRDVWKRPVLGHIAETYCEHIILTNDIAYDENPQHIVDDIARGMKTKPDILLDRRAAIRRALDLARAHTEKNVAVLITGMGIDTELSAPDGSVIPWSDAAVAREELKQLAKRDV